MWFAHHENFEENFFVFKESILPFESALRPKRAARFTKQAMPEVQKGGPIQWMMER